MGRLLVISLAWTLVSALIFLPALLGRPVAERGAQGAHEPAEEARERSLARTPV